MFSMPSIPCHSQCTCRFLEDDQYKVLRERFFEGELPNPPPSRSYTPSMPLTVDDMLNRIENRLRAVLFKACRNSDAALQTVQTLENGLLQIYRNKSDKPTKSGHLNKKDWWHELLLQEPSVTRQADSQRIITQFYFDADNASSGFHRILLNAICQFHGLCAVSRTLPMVTDESKTVRALTVKGGSMGKVPYKLYDVVADLDKTH
jgi:hypothetical protein